MYEIDSSLLAIEGQLKSQLQNLENAFEALTKELSKISSVFTNDLSNVQGCFSGGNASPTLLSEITSLEKKYTSVKEQMETELRNLLDRVNSLISQIGELKTKQAAAKSAYSYYCWVSGLTVEERTNYGVSYSYALSQKNKTAQEFESLQSSLLGELASLKGIDLNMPTLSSTDVTSLGDLTIIGRELTPVQFEYNGKNYEYLLYVPQIEENVELPMITFLAGHGERGNALQNRGLPKDITDGQDYPAIVLMPVCPTTTYMYSNEMIEVVDAMTQEVMNNYSVDKSCVGITGHSNGAVATYALVAKHPERYSVAAPVSGLMTDNNAQNWTESIASGNTSFHVVHGSWDDTLGAGKRAADNLREAGVDVEFESILAGHGIGDQVYIENDLVQYMLEDMYTKKSINNPVPKQQNSPKELQNTLD